MIGTLLNEKSLQIFKMEFHYFHFSTSDFFTIRPLFQDTLYQCGGQEISYFLVYHMSSYLVYQARYKELGGNYPKSHCDLLTLSLNIVATPDRRNIRYLTQEC